jgi:hypothetical protein
MSTVSGRVLATMVVTCFDLKLRTETAYCVTDC